MKTEDAAITPHDFDGHFSPFSYPITEIFWMLTELGEHGLSTRADHDRSRQCPLRTGNELLRRKNAQFRSDRDD